MPKTPIQFLVLATAIAAQAASPEITTAQVQFERPPISYSEAKPNNSISKLIAAIEKGDTVLKHEDEHGYLRSLLEELDVPVDSQTLVFSKTSRQRRHITPKTPRAIYFNEDVYLGWVNGGDMIEISAADPKLGAVFYTLDQRKKNDKPKMVRQFGQCMLCHTSTHTGRIPGHIVRSVFTDDTGNPVVGSHTFPTNDRSPFRERWGGWYVTGTHGKERHMGNSWVDEGESWRDFDAEAGANLTGLSERLDVSAYLNPHSDIVALMVMEHQASMHNLFTSANVQWSVHLDELRTANEGNEDEMASDELPEESVANLKMIAKNIVDGLLMKDETKLTSGITGTSDFAKTFVARGIKDKKNRSLRELDLQTRLFKYSCSYMIYSKAFAALPKSLRDEVARQLAKILNADPSSDDYSLDKKQRAAVLKILKQTRPELLAAGRKPSGE